jgi:hypothetical protein
VVVQTHEGGAVAPRRPSCEFGVTRQKIDESGRHYLERNPPAEI